MWIIIAGFVAAAVACLCICSEKHRTAHSGRARGISDDSDEYYDRVAKEPHGTE